MLQLLFWDGGNCERGYSGCNSIKMHRFQFNLIPQTLYIVELYTAYMKRGRCLVFNGGGITELAHETIDQTSLAHPKVDAMTLELEQGNIYLSNQGIWPPYNTSHKDLGLEMQIFEGKFMDWRPIVYENFGYDVGIYNPNEVSDESDLTFTVSLNHSYLFLVKPQMTIADETLISMAPIE